MKSLKRRDLKRIKRRRSLERKNSIPLEILKTTPYQCQEDAYQVGIELDQSALLMEQGTGKSLAGLCVAGYRFLAGQVNRLLIVAPLSVISVWHQEFAKHANYPYRMVDLTKKKYEWRETSLSVHGAPDRLLVTLINYEAAWRVEKLLKRWKPDMIIADESQKIKGGRKKQSRFMHKMGDLTYYKMILTGTPITQRPLDVWSQYRFLNPDIFGKRYVPFRERYAIMGGYMGYQIKKYVHLKELARKAHSIAFRVTKAEALDLPDTIDQELSVDLSSDTMRIYKEMEKEFIVQFSDNTMATAPIILTQLLRLQQITGGFLPTDDGEMKELDSAKLNALKEFLEDLPENKKVVIFARFIAEIEAIKRVSASLGRKPLTLSGKTKDRGRVIKRFQKVKSFKDMIVQIQSGGLGITLTAADTAVFYSTTFSFADYDQAKARLHRIGQKHPVTYIHLLANGTVDSHILDILKDKGDIATKILDKLVKNSPKKPFTNGPSSLIIEPEGRKGGNPNRMYSLDNKPKGGWYWDESTGWIIRLDAETHQVDKLKRVDTLEEAQDLVDNLTKKTLSNLMKEDNPIMVKKLSKKERKQKKEAEANMAKKTKKQKETKVQEPEEQMEEAIEELEEVVEDEVKTEAKPKKVKKTKKTQKAEEPAEPKKTKKVKKTKKDKKAKAAAPAPEKKVKKAKKAQVDETANEVTAKELAAQLNIDPKALRKTLRDMFPEHDSKERWVWKKGSKELNTLIKKLSK